MKKILVGIAAFAMTLTCFADPTVFTDTQIDGTLEVTGATTLSGATSLGSASVSALTVTAATGVWASQNVTNAQVVTIGGFNVLNGVGQANGSTNTITLANAVDGRIAVLTFGGSNLVAIADSGTAKLSQAFQSTADDTLVLIGVGTNWLEVSRSVN